MLRAFKGVGLVLFTGLDDDGQGGRELPKLLKME
jgi:hypothetical protein